MVHPFRLRADKNRYVIKNLKISQGIPFSGLGMYNYWFQYFKNGSVRHITNKYTGM